MKKSLSCLIGICICSAAFSQWNSNPTINTPISTVANNQQDVRIVTDSKSGAIITWVDYRNSTAAADIYVQRVNASGYPLWTANGKAICTDAADQTAVNITDAGNGSAILTWQDWRNGDEDIYAQKVDSSGNVLWTTNGVPVCVKTYTQSGPKIINDGAGGAIIVWEDSSAGTWDIYAQRISSTGAQMWTANGVIICSALNSQINPKIDIDGNGGGIITWQDKRNGSDYDIYAQHVNALGAIQWTANGVAISTAIDAQTNPKIEPDGTGGAIIGWQDKRNGTDYDVYVQRINASGAVQWLTNGIGVCKTTGSQSAVDMTTYGVNGVIVSWKDDRSGTVAVYANMLNPSGVVQWVTNGIVLGNGVNPSVIGNGSGGAIIAWQDSTSGTWNVRAQNLDSGGSKLWAPAGVDVGTAASDQTSPKNVPAGNGGVIFAWQDKRNGNNFDVYAHHFTVDGTSSVTNLNENPSIVCYPNPFSFQTTLYLNIPVTSEGLQLSLYDITGKIVFLQTINNSKSITLYRNELPTGLYFYQIVNQTQIVGKGKLSIVD